jgi:hypothetical protein
MAQLMAQLTVKDYLRRLVIVSPSQVMVARLGRSWSGTRLPVLFKGMRAPQIRSKRKRPNARSMWPCRRFPTGCSLLGSVRWETATQATRWPS